MLQILYNNIPSSPFRNEIDVIPNDNITKTEYVTINEHPLIKDMNKEISKAKENIENPIMYHKKMTNIKNLIRGVLNRCIFIVQQIIKLGELNGENEKDLIIMMESLKKLNKICYDIYGCK